METKVATLYRAFTYYPVVQDTILLSYVSCHQC